MNTDTKKLLKKFLGEHGFKIRKDYGPWGLTYEELDEFVNMIRADEREECAKLCEKAIKSIFEFSDEIVKETARNVCTNLANRIRARGNE